MTVTERQIDWIRSQSLPVRFYGKENWLGFKLTPHTPMMFINEVNADGVKTNTGTIPWDQMPAAAVATIYQRMKLEPR